MTCKCGFKFSEPGEFRNCQAFITAQWESGVVCPDCGRNYVSGFEVRVDEDQAPRRES